MSSSLFRKKTIEKIVADSNLAAGDVHGGGLHKVLKLKDLTFLV